MEEKFYRACKNRNINKINSIIKKNYQNIFKCKNNTELILNMLIIRHIERVFNKKQIFSVFKNNQLIKETIANYL